MKILSRVSKCHSKGMKDFFPSIKMPFQGYEKKPSIKMPFQGYEKKPSIKMPFQGYENFKPSIKMPFQGYERFFSQYQNAIPRV